MNEPQRTQPEPRWSLLNENTSCAVVDDLRIADGYWSKLAGLQFRAPLPVGRGLLLVKSASIHTFWMRFPIDVAFIGSDGRVLGVRRGIRPWRTVLGAPGTHAILETTAGWLELDVGVRLAAVCTGSHQGLRLRRSLSFLGSAAHGISRGELATEMESERHDA